MWPGLVANLLSVGAAAAVRWRQRQQFCLLDPQNFAIMAPMDTTLDIKVRRELDLARGCWHEIAKSAGVSHSWISQFVRNKIPNPGHATLKALAGALMARRRTHKRDA